MDAQGLRLHSPGCSLSGEDVCAGLEHHTTSCASAVSSAWWWDAFRSPLSTSISTAVTGPDTVMNPPGCHTYVCRMCMKERSYISAASGVFMQGFADQQEPCVPCDCRCSGAVTVPEQGRCQPRHGSDTAK